MKKDIKKILIFLFVTILLSCTSYQSEGIGGGYTVMPLGANRYRIEVRGNGLTNRSRVEKIAMVKAADISLRNNFKYFFIIDTKTNQRIKSARIHDSGNVTTIKNNYITITIEVSNKSEGIDADFIIQEYGDEIGYSR